MKAAVNNDFEIAGFCDINLSKVSELKEKTGMQISAIKEYTDYKEMLREERPDLVSIATESGLHAEVALYCIDKGVNCIIEKPIAKSIADADRIIGLAKEKM